MAPTIMVARIYMSSSISSRNQMSPHSVSDLEFHERSIDMTYATEDGHHIHSIESYIKSELC